MVKIEIDIKQIKKAIERLPEKDRIRLVENLTQRTWAQQFRKLLTRIDTRRKTNPISQKELNKVIDESRQEYHVKSRR